MEKLEGMMFPQHLLRLEKKLYWSEAQNVKIANLYIIDIYIY